MYTSERQIDVPVLDVLSWTFDNRVYDHERPIWIDPYESGNTICAREARCYVRCLIGGLRKCGLQSGDTVCVHSFNNIWYPLIYLAVIGSGGRFIGSNPAYKPADLTRLFSISNAKYLIVERDLLPNIKQVAFEYGIKQANVFLFDTREEIKPTGAPFASLRDLLQTEEGDWISFDDKDMAQKTPAVLLCTSGTSGLPKAAVMSHYAILAQAVVAFDQAEGIGWETRRLLSLPLFHSFVLPYNLLALRRGQPTYIMPRFNAEDFAKFIDRHQITTVAVVPQIALTLFGAALPKQQSYSSLKEVICAGAPLSRDLQNKLAKTLQSNASFYQFWGMSELGWVTGFKHPAHDETGAAGRLFPNSCAKIINEDGNEVSVEGSSGEILIKNSGVMLGYLNDQEGSRASYIDGWFRTGDIGYFKEGKLYIVDRAKDMIKVRGWQVSPAEIEACLILHPRVKDAAVIGVDGGDGIGELPLACVVVVPGQQSERDLKAELQKCVKERLASYKALDGGVEVVDTIPRSAAGKILRRLLRDNAQRKVAIEKEDAEEDSTQPTLEKCFIQDVVTEVEEAKC